jgi:hypothetical protein
MRDSSGGYRGEGDSADDSDALHCGEGMDRALIGRKKKRSTEKMEGKVVSLS